MPHTSTTIQRNTDVEFPILEFYGKNSIQHVKRIASHSAYYARQAKQWYDESRRWRFRTELCAVSDRTEPDTVTARNVPRLTGLVADDDCVLAAALQTGSLWRIKVSASEHCTPPSLEIVADTAEEITAFSHSSSRYTYNVKVKVSASCPLWDGKRVPAKGRWCSAVRSKGRMLILFVDKRVGGR